MCCTYSKDMSALGLVVACVVLTVKICPPYMSALGLVVACVVLTVKICPPWVWL